MNALHRLCISTCALALLGGAPAGAQQAVQLPARDRLLEGRPQTVFAVGAAEGQDWEMFGAVASVAFDGEENLYVLDRAGYRVLVFGPTGEFLRQFGKQGGGPGELQAPVAMTVTADGAVVITDLARRAFSIFSRGGAFQRNVLFPEEAGLPGLVLGGHPGGGVVLTTRPLLLLREASGSAPNTGDRVPIVWLPFGAESRPVRLFEAPVPRPKIETGGSASGGNRTVRVGAPPVFSPGVHWGVLPGGGVAVAHEAGYSVKVVSGAGEVDRVLQRGIEPRKATPRDRDRARERRREQMESGAGTVRVTNANGRVSTSVGGAAPKELVERALQEMEFAETVPVIQAMTTDPQGRLWIERTGKVAFEPGAIDLVTARGRYIGTLRGEKLPAAFSRGGRAAYIEKDELGVERVVVRRLPEAWR